MPALRPLSGFITGLDEATEGLSPIIREEIWSCRGQLRAQGQTILLIDKYAERLLALADRHTVIERGRVVWNGSSAQLRAEPAIWHKYVGVEAVSTASSFRPCHPGQTSYRLCRA